MTIKFIKPLMFLSTILTLNTSISCITGQDSQKQSQTTTQSKNDSTDLYSQKIVCPEMDLLNKLFLLKPINALRLKRAYTDAREVINYLKETQPESTQKITDKKTEVSTKTLSPEEESQKILELRDKLLIPITSFFTNLYDHQTLLSPLVVIIFKTTKFATAEDELNKTLMLQFFQVDKQTAQTFFNDIMVTREALLKVCNEFEPLFGVVNASMSEEVKKKAAELEQKAIAAKKQQLANQKTKDKQTKNNQEKSDKK